MYAYNLATYKNIPHNLTYLEQLKAVNAKVVAFVDTGSNLKVQSTESMLQSEIDALDAVQPNPEPDFDHVNQVVIHAANFGSQLILESATENVMLGITEANMTNVVRKRLHEVYNALQSGALYDAIYEMRQIPAECFDPVFITEARLLAKINKVETYLGLPLSTEY